MNFLDLDLNSIYFGENGVPREAGPFCGLECKKKKKCCKKYKKGKACKSCPKKG